MDDLRRLLRYVMPGFAWAIVLLVMSSVALPAWTFTTLVSLSNAGGAVLAVGAVVVSGGLGFIFSVFHHWLHNVNLLRYPSNHRDFLTRCVEEDKKLTVKCWRKKAKKKEEKGKGKKGRKGKDEKTETAKGTKGKKEKEGEMELVKVSVSGLSRQGIWRIMAALWHELAENEDGKKEGDKRHVRQESLGSIAHGLGASTIASLGAVVAFLFVRRGPGMPPWAASDWLAILVGLALVMVLYLNTRTAMRHAYRVPEIEMTRMFPNMEDSIEVRVSEDELEHGKRATYLTTLAALAIVVLLALAAFCHGPKDVLTVEEALQWTYDENGVNVSGLKLAGEHKDLPNDLPGMSVTIRNKTDDAVRIAVMVALYDAKGKLLGAARLAPEPEGQLKSGETGKVAAWLPVLSGEVADVRFVKLRVTRAALPRERLR